MGAALYPGHQPSTGTYRRVGLGCPRPKARVALYKIDLLPINPRRFIAEARNQLRFPAWRK